MRAICCPPRLLVGELADMGMHVCVGFGSATVELDGEVLIDGERPEMYPQWRRLCDRRDYVRLYRVESYARRHPGEWRVLLSGPLQDSEWRREGPNRWVCTRVGEGFA